MLQTECNVVMPKLALNESTQGLDEVYCTMQCRHVLKESSAVKGCMRLSRSAEIGPHRALYGDGGGLWCPGEQG